VNPNAAISHANCAALFFWHVLCSDPEVDWQKSIRNNLDRCQKLEHDLLEFIAMK